MKHFIAIAQIEQNKRGERSYVEPGHPVFLSNEKDIATLLRLKAIRNPTQAEIELEALRSGAPKTPTAAELAAANAEAAAAEAAAAEAAAAEAAAAEAAAKTPVAEAVKAKAARARRRAADDSDI